MSNANEGKRFRLSRVCPRRDRKFLTPGSAGRDSPYQRSIPACRGPTLQTPTDNCPSRSQLVRIWPLARRERMHCERTSEQPSISSHDAPCSSRLCLVVLVPLLLVQIGIYMAWFSKPCSGRRADEPRNCSVRGRVAVLTICGNAAASASATRPARILNTITDQELLARTTKNSSFVQAWTLGRPDGKIIASSNRRAIGSDIPTDHFETLKNGGSSAIATCSPIAQRVSRSSRGVRPSLTRIGTTSVGAVPRHCRDRCLQLPACHVASQ